MSSEIPKLHVYVSPSALNPRMAVAFLRQHMANYEAVYVGQGIHFIQEDQPEAIGRNINDWYYRTNQRH
ncbi:MAG: hypothetical protein AAF639_06255 [Chloroflexota bacterium]